MIHAADLLAIVLMALTTYATRTIGYFVLGDRVLGARTKAVLEAAPACVLLAVIAPAFVVPRLADLLALAITLLAALRLPMLATVLVAIVSAGTLRFALG